MSINLKRPIGSPAQTYRSRLEITSRSGRKLEHSDPVFLYGKDIAQRIGAITKNLRSTEICPEFSYDWVEKEFETMGTRMADPFQIPKDTAAEMCIRDSAYPYPGHSDGIGCPDQ